MRVVRVLAPLLGLGVLVAILWRVEGPEAKVLIGVIAIWAVLLGGHWSFHVRSRSALEARGAHRIGPVKLFRKAPLRVSWSRVVVYVLDGSCAYALVMGPFRGLFRQLYRAGQPATRVPGTWWRLRAHGAWREGEHAVIRIGEVVPYTTLRFGPLPSEDADRIVRALG